MIHLDTSFLIRALIAGSPQDADLRRWLRSQEPLGISTIAWAEFRCGPLSEELSATALEIVGSPHPFGADEAELSARLFNAAGRRRGTLADCMIAASAISHDAELATVHVADYSRFKAQGLRLVATFV